MRTSIIPAICALVVSTLALPSPASSELEKRQTVNEPWFIGNWYDEGTSSETHKHTVRFQISAPDAYIEGFYGFGGWCEPITVNACNSTICFGYGDQWHVETRVSISKVTNRTSLWVRHVQTTSGKTVTATGSTDNFVPVYPAAELYPTDVTGF
ncbi:hypothetical protein GGR54DRAFT_328036 [Hypoxylon sp. NC1633]|nr:hypothetical protein GGR54DRAFT_328036 [Hypoxylon sp. NC1633]